MYVKNAVYDEWDHNTDIGGMIEITSWEIAENLIKSLDGSKYTQVILSNELDDSFICIGGGNNGFYNVFISLDDNESFYDLLNPSGKHDNIIQLVTGGQSGDFEEDICVTIDKALLASQKFYVSGKVEETLKWRYRS
jgi:hypothetical protein